MTGFWMRMYGVRLLRVRGYAHFLLAPLAVVRPFHDGSTVEGVARGVLAAFCLLSFAYLVNDWNDRALDAAEKQNPVVRANAGVVEYAATLVALTLTAMVAAGFNSVLALMYALMSWVAGWVYSAGPRLKKLPLVGTLTNGFIFTPLLFLGVEAGLDFRMVERVAWVFAPLLLQNQLLHEAADADDDRAGGVSTTFLAAGPTLTGWFVGLLPIAAALGILARVVAAMAAGAGDEAGGAMLGGDLGALGDLSHVTLWLRKPLSIATTSLVVLVAMGAVFGTLAVRYGDNRRAMGKIRVAQRYAAAMGCGAAWAVNALG